MASSKERERRLARAKVERQLRYRADRVRRQRQTRAAVGIGLAVLLILGAVGFSAGWFDFSGPKKQTASADCAWTPDGPDQGYGTPAASDVTNSGTSVMAITTNLGPITIEVDNESAPCMAASFRYLASQNYFDGTTCHKLLDDDPYALVCGSKTGLDGSNAGYRYAVENLPQADPTPVPTASASASAASSATASASPSDNPSPMATYRKGTVALASTGLDGGGTEFFIFFKDSKLLPEYGILGTVTDGQKIIDEVGAAGSDGSFAANGGGGKPKKSITITTLTFGEPGATPTATPTATATPSASASAAN